MSDEFEISGSFNRRAEVEALWQADDTWTGEVFRQVQKVKSQRVVYEPVS
jgi:hypothetical protein